MAFHNNHSKKKKKKGFLIMQNKLKSDTTGHIQQLNDAHFRTIMITGDNPLTALCSGKRMRNCTVRLVVGLGLEN